MARWYQHEGELQGEGEAQWEEAQGEVRGGRRGRGPRAAPRPRPAPRAAQATPRASYAPPRRGSAQGARWSWLRSRAKPAPPRRGPPRRRHPRWAWLRPRLPWLVPGGVLPWTPGQPPPEAAPPPAAYGGGASPAAEPPGDAGAAPPGDVADQPPEDAAAEPPEDAEPSGDGAAAAPDEGGEPQAETFAKRFARGTKPVLSWAAAPFALKDFTLKGALAGMPRGNGIYLVALTPEPGAPLIYVGETDDLAGRWRDRLVGVYQVGLLDPGPLPRTLYIWFGAMVGGRTVRKNVEHAINRTLLISGLGSTLRNQSSFRPFDAGDVMEIRNLLPPAIASKVRLRAMTQELALRGLVKPSALQARHLQSVRNLLKAYLDNHLTLTAGMRYELQHP